MPIRYAIRGGKIINKTPKIIAIMPKTGLETVTPNLLRLLSTTSVKKCSSIRIGLEIAILTLLEPK